MRTKAVVQNNISRLHGTSEAKPNRAKSQNNVKILMAMALTNVPLNKVQKERKFRADL